MATDTRARDPFHESHGAFSLSGMKMECHLTSELLFDAALIREHLKNGDDDGMAALGKSIGESVGDRFAADLVECRGRVLQTIKEEAKRSAGKGGGPVGIRVEVLITFMDVG